MREKTTDLIPIAIILRNVLWDSEGLIGAFLTNWQTTRTLVDISLEIPSGRLRNASLASSDKRPNGAVSL